MLKQDMKHAQCVVIPTVELQDMRLVTDLKYHVKIRIRRSETLMCPSNGLEWFPTEYRAPSV